MLHFSRIICAAAVNNLNAMKNLSLSILSDAILSLAAILIALLCIFRSLGLNFPLALFFAFVAAACFSAAITVRNTAKRKRRLDDGNVKAEKRSLANTLSLIKNSELIDLFAGIFEIRGIKLTKTDGALETENLTLIPLFAPESLTATGVADAVKRSASAGKTAVVISSSYTSEAIRFAAESGVKLVGLDEVFSLFKEHAPEFIKSERRAAKRYEFKRFFEKQNSGKLVFYGVMLCIFGFFAFYPVYYAISGGLFIFAGLTMRFLGKPSALGATTFDSLFANEKTDENK